MAALLCGAFLLAFTVTLNNPHPTRAHSDRASGLNKRSNGGEHGVGLGKRQCNVATAHLFINDR
ncbi:hypothetical protein JOB18_029559 [Solea senegalensis]|uniref:Secreted protein n=1 Tax=Solea senegalensis TaxID=28829 RepID=A0AAV6SKP0_SOLSE|nr:hypothetical protein JOB18_029559 [Solea senegalensis]